MDFDKYERMGAYHWKEFYRPSHPAYRAHALHVANWVKGDKILDIGCGDGLITFLLGAKGIDNNRIAVRLARARDVDAIVFDIYDCQFFNGFYDAIYLGDTIEHLEFANKAMEAIGNLADNLYIATPPAQDDGELYDPYHYREYTPSQLIEFVEDFGWTIVDCSVSSRSIYAHFKK